jgi:hypothetical protein
VSDLVRLNVNLNQETAKALRKIKDDNGIDTITETVRRVISVAHYIYSELAAGRKIQTMDQDGKNVREMVLM